MKTSAIGDGGTTYSLPILFLRILLDLTYQTDRQIDHVTYRWKMSRGFLNFVEIDIVTAAAAVESCQKLTIDRGIEESKCRSLGQ